VEDLKPWDIAAGAIILTEAGGTVCHTSGSKFDVMKPDCVCAATPELAKNVISLIEEADQITDRIRSFSMRSCSFFCSRSALAW